jgi:CO/xanthine dehydrogenase Mo-binding subunit
MTETGWNEMNNSRYRYIGKSAPRTDAYEKITGGALYPGDLSLPGMLHMKVLFAGRPHARIIKIGVQHALAVPGVFAVLTGADVPVNNFGLVFNDQPVLCDQVVRFEGDKVAIVLAESEAIADRARDLIEVVYEDLPPLTDPRQAMKPGSTRLHTEYADNILDHVRIRKGNIDEGLASADVIVESQYFLPMQEHAYLQPEAGMAYMDGEVVVVESAGQWAHHDQRQIARSLGIETERVRVVYRAIGGAFGGREDISVQIVLALAAFKTGRPVKIVWTRPESIRGHGKRHQMFITSRWGAMRDGRIVAADVDVISDAGAYAYTSTMVLGNTALTCTGVYNIPHIRVDAVAVYTNNVPGAAFRGFGSPQGCFSAEMQINKIAHRLDLDPVKIREINLLKPGDPMSSGTAVAEWVRLDELLFQCAERAGWQRAGRAWKKPEPSPCSNDLVKTGHGIALGMKNIGFSFGFPEGSSAVIVLSGEAEIEAVDVYFAGAECGQGIETAARQMAAEALSIPLEKVRVIGADTARSPESGSASASRMTMLGGNAILGAAREALESWNNEERPAKGVYTYHAPLTTNFDPKTGSSKPHVAYSPIAQAVEVKVNIETGEVRVPGVVSVVDTGQAINPALLNGQIDGAVIQGLGYSLMENFITQDGLIETVDLTTYLIPTVADIPEENEAILCQHPEAVGPWGARGIGETPLIAIAPAVAGGVHAATGIWFDTLPLTPQTVFLKIHD